MRVISRNRGRAVEVCPLHCEGVCGPKVIARCSNSQARYLTEHQKNKFLDEGEAVLEISFTCLTYLCSDLLEPDIGDEVIERNITSGAYRLLHFAHHQWAECLRLCTRHFRDELPPQLVPLLGHIMLDLGNPYFNQDSDTSLGLWSLDKFRSNLEEVKTIPRGLDFCSSMAGSYDWRLDEGNITTQQIY